MKMSHKPRMRFRKNFRIGMTRNTHTISVIPSIHSGNNRTVTGESVSKPVGSLKEFCAETTIHGIRYFTEPKLHWLERVWWVIAVISSMILCAMVIENVWINWRDHPVIVTLDDKTTPISRVPFPALTICTTQKFVPDKVKLDMNVVEEIIFSDAHLRNIDYSKLTFDDINQINALILLCGKRFVAKNPFKKSPQSRSIYKIAQEIAPDKDFLVAGAFINATDIMSQLHPVFTELGVCYVLNTLNSHEMYSDVVAPELLTVVGNPNSNWNADNGYAPTAHMSQFYPRNKALVFDLWFGMRIKFDDFLPWYSGEPGCKICLHMPDEPIDAKKCIHSSLDARLVIDIDVSVMSTSENLHSYSPHVRGCYFSHERQLYYFKLYSRKKCEIECWTNFTKEILGCVHYYMPRDNDTALCTMAEQFSGIPLRIYDRTHSFTSDQCDCLPDCNSVSLNFEVTQSHKAFHSIDDYGEYLDGFKSYGIYNEAVLQFKEKEFIAVIRSERSTMSDFIASCGGLLGLFMGISMLSIVELIYYFTLRLFCKLRQRNYAWK